MAKSFIGTVTSSKADKTIVVTVQTRKTHPLYRKQYTVATKFMAHDEKNEAQNGDKVEIVESRPISARKHFTLSRIIDKPVLRENALEVIKSDDSSHVASKSKVVKEAEKK
jgi:small subunit ribosomal protein S17